MTEMRSSFFRKRSVLVSVALLIGARLFLAMPFDVSLWETALLVVAALLALLPFSGRLICAGLDRLRRPSLRMRLSICAIVWLASMGYLIANASQQHRDFSLRIHDENCYAIQSRMLAHGRLWMPQHPLADFFESFYLFVRPVYASIYFPGTALLYAPMEWLGLQTWVLPTCVAGLALSVAYLGTTAVIDGIAGLLVVILTLSVHVFRVCSTVVMAQVPVLLFGILTICFWLAWRRKQHFGWLFLIGGTLGWAAITRPIDALSFGLPVLSAIVFQLRGRPPRKLALTGTLILAGSLPFLSLQLCLDRATTGHFLQTPYTTYLQHDMPGLIYGFHQFDPSRRPASRLPEKLAFYNALVNVENIAAHRFERLPQIICERSRWTLDDTVAASLLFLLLPPALLGLRQLPQVVVLSIVPLYMLLYLPNPVALPHYAVPLVFPMACWIALGAETCRVTWPNGWQGRFVTAFVPLSVIIVAGAALPQFHHYAFPDAFFRLPPSRLIAVQDQLSRAQTPAIVLFRYDPADDAEQEPVYNSDVAWPDDATIIRAHDLGVSRDRELVSYYAHRGPVRSFYLFDARWPQPLKLMGTTDNPEAINHAIETSDLLAGPG
jgi:hypothetical protein